MAKKVTTTEPLLTIEPEKKSQLPLLKNNFIIIGISIAMIVLGFVLIGGSPSTLDAYNEEIFSTRRIVIGPMIAFLGFVALAIGIIIKPRSKSDKHAATDKAQTPNT